MEIILIENDDKDQLLLDKYSKMKLTEDGEEKDVDEPSLQQKKEIWNLAKMETMVSNDETLTNRYNNMAIDGSFKFGYHWNEVIMNLLFNEYVLEDPRYMQKYLNTIAKKKKRRGNPDKKISKDDFKGYEFKKDYENTKKIKENMNINENNVRLVRDINSDDYEFISNSQDVDSIKRDFNIVDPEEYDSFFVRFTPDGDVLEIWGMSDVIPDLSKRVYLVYPETVNETTTSASSGQFSGPFIWAKNKSEMRFARKPMYAGGQIVEGIQYYESILDELNEEKKTSSMINKERIGKENAVNFNKDMENSNIKDIVAGFEVINNIVKVDDVKSHQDIEDEQVEKMKDFKPVKHERTDEYNKKVELHRGYGMQDLKYDIKPSERFVERQKEHMGEDMYEKGQEKIEYEKNRPMYNKDNQPTISKSEFDKKIEESHFIFGKYKIGNKSNIVEFDINNIELTESVNDDYTKININGMGNIYDNRGSLNETIKGNVDKYDYYINLDNKKILKVVKNLNENNSVKIDKFIKLANYSSFKSMKG